MINTDVKNIKFEDYIFTEPNEDLFEKTKRLDKVLSKGLLTGNEALGMVTMNKVQPSTTLREKTNELNEVIMLGSNSYLNLTTHPQVMTGARQALDEFGYGMGAVSNYAGITDLHKELESRIARFHRAEGSIVFPSGYGTNIGVISAICGKGDIIINDSANHASIFDGCKLSEAEIKVYPHGDMKYLERILSRIPNEVCGRLIITDGVFSMDGDMAKLDKICDLAEKYHCRVMVDDAHGVGIVGRTGRGTAEHYDVIDRVDLHVGMLSKGPGGLGGYCATSREIVQYLRLYARTYFFSTALPAPLAGGLNEVFKLLETDTAGRKELLEKTEYLKFKLLENGFDIGQSQSCIVPVMVYNEEKLFKIYQDLRKNGVYVNIVTYPAVRRKECRLRLCMMKDLPYEMIDKAVMIVKTVFKSHNCLNA